MKKSLSFFLVLFFGLVFSQKTISGTIKDSDGRAVPSASVTVEEPGKDAIIAYAISNSKGEYKITFTSASPTVDLKLKAFNHKTSVKSIKNETQNLNFNMESEATEIKEVVLKTKIITKKGDTISYDLKAFENKSDRSLADVLKKIPGIEVNTDGSILYQGNPINKFYVNGKDLMEGAYGTINNSLPKDAVSKVEVLENHQPVKMLQDKIPSDAAAINIKLKKAVTITGRGEVGSGFGEPWLWNLKLTPMFFGQKSQWVVNYKTNNVGESVENEGNMLAFGNRWEGRRSQSSQNDWLNVETAGTPSVPEKRYLYNNVHFLSANYLVSPFKNKEWELKANANYTNNTISREGYTEINNYQLNSHYFTNIMNKFYTDKVKGEIIFTKNAKKGFFKNITTYNQYWNADRSDVNRTDAQGNRLGHEAIESPTVSFQNSLSTIIPWKKKMVNIQSYLAYQTDRQNLDVSPSNYLQFNYRDSQNNSKPFVYDSNFVRQNFSMKTFTANTSVNMGFTQKFWTFTPEIGLNYSNVHMDSDLLGLDYTAMNFNKNDYMNDLKFINTVPYASLGINFKNDSWMLFSRIPFNFNHINAADPARSVDKGLNKMTFEPNLFAQYSFLSFWKASLNGGISYNFGDEGALYGGYMLRNPASVTAMNPKNPILESRSNYAGSRIEYRNPLNNLFFNVNYRLGSSWRNLTASASVNDLGYTVTNYVNQENKGSNNSLSGEVGKYFPKLKTNASVTYNNSNSKSQLLQNNDPFTSKANSQSTGFKFNNAYFSWLSVDFNMNYSWRKQNSITGLDVKTNGYNHNLSVFIYPVDNHTIGFNWDQVNSKNSSQTYRNPFFDISYQYTWAKKKMDFELKWLNIANRKVFETYSVGAFTDSYTRYQLRPSQVMLTVKFNFN